MKNIKVMLFFKNVLLWTFYQRKVNEGELPQYYVTDDHEVIIDRGTFDLVQTELVKRRGVQGRTVFSGKIKCAECGCYYGAKVWHSIDKENLSA